MLTSAAQGVLRRDRLIVAAGLVIVTLLAWAYVAYLSAAMAAMPMDSDMNMGINSSSMSMPVVRAWDSGDALYTFSMWAVMMVAMMTPSAAPMILTYTGLRRQRGPSSSTGWATAAFVAGYFIVWTVFSAAATFMQWGLHSLALLSDGTLSISPVAGGVLLMAAGIYQFTSFKRSCLSNCRSPMSFLITDWREGVNGALVMGLRHGAYCVGCCWLLMLLLFVSGVMSLVWVAIIAVFVLIEKITPAGQWLSRAAGLFMLGWGGWLLLFARG